MYNAYATAAPFDSLLHAVSAAFSYEACKSALPWGLCAEAVLLPIPAVLWRDSFPHNITTRSRGAEDITAMALLFMHASCCMPPADWHNTDCRGVLSDPESPGRSPVGTCTSVPPLLSSGTASAAPAAATAGSSSTCSGSAWLGTSRSAPTELPSLPLRPELPPDEEPVGARKSCGAFAAAAMTAARPPGPMEGTCGMPSCASESMEAAEGAKGSAELAWGSAAMAGDPCVGAKTGSVASNARGRLSLRGRRRKGRADVGSRDSWRLELGSRCARRHSRLLLIGCACHGVQRSCTNAAGCGCCGDL